MSQVSLQFSSINFAFLQKNEPLLFRLACLAEALFPTDPNTSLLKARQFGEALAQQVSAHSKRRPQFEERQIDLLNRLKSDGLLPKSMADMLHFIRKKGNLANHQITGTANDALTCITVSYTHLTLPTILLV